jgi:hypothetical protein
MDNQGESSLIQILRIKAIKTRAQLLELLEYWHYINFVLIPLANEKYLRAFGKLENELNYLNHLAYQINNKLNFLYKRFAKSKSIHNRSIYSIQFSKYYNQYRENSENIEQLSNFMNSNSSPNLKSMYFAIAKKLHPDSSNNSTMFNRFWNILIIAYKSSDVFVMTLLYNALCFDLCKFYFNEASEEKTLLERIYILEEGINTIKGKIKALLQKKPLLYFRKLDNPLWIKNRQKEILYKISNIRRKIKLQRTFITVLNFTPDNIV